MGEYLLAMLLLSTQTQKQLVTPDTFVHPLVSEQRAVEEHCTPRYPFIHWVVRRVGEVPIETKLSCVPKEGPWVLNMFCTLEREECILWWSTMPAHQLRLMIDREMRQSNG